MLRDYEVKAISSLTGDHLSSAQISALTHATSELEIEHTPSGYFLKIKCSELPDFHRTCGDHHVVAKANGLEAQFVVHLEPGALVLECYSYEKHLPADFRNANVTLTVA